MFLKTLKDHSLEGKKTHELGILMEWILSIFLSLMFSQFSHLNPYYGA